MKILRTVAELRRWREGLSDVGFVPTMGALHFGHESLLRQAREQSRHVLLSIFVNPTQFNQTQDLAAYPRTEAADLRMAERCGVDAVFIPDSIEEMYPDAYAFEIREKELSRHLCGVHRPGHFEGMLTVVMKLFILTRPSRAYLGEKDFQQLKLVEGMVKAFFLDVEIVRCATVREADGLALSSRNLRLQPQERECAPFLHQALTRIPDLTAAREALTERGFKVEYLEEMEGRRLVAAWLGNVRLIDNVPL